MGGTRPSRAWDVEGQMERLHGLGGLDRAESRLRTFELGKAYTVSIQKQSHERTKNFLDHTECGLAKEGGLSGVEMGPKGAEP